MRPLCDSTEGVLGFVLYFAFGLFLSTVSIGALAQAAVSRDRPTFAIGLSQSFAPDFLGSASSSAKLRPIVAVRYRRIRLSSSGGSSILSFGQGHSGASAELFNVNRLKVRAALRVTSGRDQSSFPELSGLPDVDRTVIGRISAFYPVTPKFGIGGRVSWDLLNRSNGATIAAILQYRMPVSNSSIWSMGASLTWADATHMNAWYGVPLSAQTVLRPAYSPGGGFRNFEMNMGLITKISPGWVAFVGLQVSQALSRAAISPISHADISGSFRFGIGYRCCAAGR